MTKNSARLLDRLELQGGREREREGDEKKENPIITVSTEWMLVDEFAECMELNELVSFENFPFSCVKLKSNDVFVTATFFDEFLLSIKKLKRNRPARD